MENERAYDLKKYLILAFAMAWVFQAAGSVLAIKGIQLGFTACLSLAMLTPMVAVLITCRGLKKDVSGVAWMPRLRGNMKWWLTSWLLPVGLAVLGCAIFYLVFPSAFDPTFSEYTIAQAGEEAFAQSYGAMPAAVIRAVMLVSAVGGAFVNAIFAVGEEAGWRGYMYPALKAGLGRAPGRVVGGLIWGCWHWPVMALAGYEYGWSFFNAPAWKVIAGMLLFCVFATSAGIVLDWLYERTGSIWAPALAHGAINASVGLGMVMLKMSWADRMHLGPTPIGVIAGLPFILLAVWILWKDKDPS